ncbi:hypothetical protein CDCE8392_2086 [Corynebacterium diphtheriae CDCE 8392]|nr:hypothetical protein CDCE8392_2086 [Corynebacterium diphtheriae CDCE 8392]
MEVEQVHKNRTLQWRLHKIMEAIGSNAAVNKDKKIGTKPKSIW